MTIKLSDTMHKILKRAPNDWRKITEFGSFSTIEALESRALVQVRFKPGDKRMLAEMEWKITEAGKIVDGRVPA